MKITSVAFKDGEFIPSIYSYQGGNQSPPLHIEEIPDGAKSLCLIVHDPDAPVGDYLHWLVWNIDPNQKQISQNEQFNGAILGNNDFGNKKWDGPSPPSGTHRYIFELYALDSILSLDDTTKRQQLEKTINSYIIDSAKLTGLYSK